MGNRFGWHSGVMHCKDAKVQGDLYVQDDIVFSDVSAGTLGITGGLDLGGSVSAIGIDMDGITCTTAAIDIQGTGLTGRAIRIGVKDTGLKISTTGYTLDEEPSNNYLFGLFSAVTATEATSTDELRSAWIRTRVNVNCDIGSNAGWGYGICGAEVQLKFYGGTTKVYAWQNSALWAQIESQAATTTFKSGSYTQAVLANIGLTTATIDSGAVVAGVTVNANSASITNNGAYYGLFITDKNTTSTDFTSAIWVADSVATTGITLGNCTTGILLDGTYTTGINMVGGVSYNPIHIGVKDNVADKGLILTGVTDDTGGIMVFCDDGGDALGSVTSPIWTRYLITTSQSGGATATGAYLQLKNNAATFTTGSYTALKAFYQCGGATTLAGSAEMSIINAGISFEGNLTNTLGTLSGVDININDGTKTVGTSSGLLVRKTSGSTAGWTYGVNIADSGAVTGINIGTCTTGINLDGTITTGIVMEPSAMTNGIIIGTPNTASGYGLQPNMTDSWSVGAPVSFYFDDGGSAITSWGECFTVGFVVTANSTGATQTGWPYTAFFYKDIQANITSATTQHWATVMMNTSIASAKTVDGFDNQGLSTLHVSADVNGTLAAGTTLANLSFGGNSPGTISGTWVCMHVRDTIGDFSALMKVDANATGCYTESYTGNSAFVPNSKGTFTQTGQLRLIVNGNTVYVPYGTVA